MLRALYVIAIGLLFAGVVGLGVEAFYDSPTYPTCEREEVSQSLDKPLTVSTNCQAEIDAYEERSDQISTNKSFVYMAIAVIIIVISLFGLGGLEVIGDGITLGGVFVLFVGLVQSLATENDILKFFFTLAGLIVVLLLSYWKFIRHEKKS